MKFVRDIFNEESFMREPAREINVDYYILSIFDLSYARIPILKYQIQIHMKQMKKIGASS